MPWRCESLKDGNCENWKYEENQCPDEQKQCGTSFPGTETDAHGLCPKVEDADAQGKDVICKCLEWTCPDGGALNSCKVEDRICKDGCKYCEKPHAVCPKNMVDDTPSKLKPAWNLIR